MQFLTNITNLADDCVSEILKMCGATINTYPLNDIVRRFNSALDRYFSLAFEADNRWNFDDINEASPPIDNQNIVSGTNRYKIGTFTEKIINLIRLEILDSAGKGLSLIPETMADLTEISVGHETGRVSGISTDTFQERYINASSGVPTHYIKYGDFIYLRPNPNYSYTSGLKAYFNRPASYYEFVTFTVTIASPGVFTATAHGLAANDVLILNTTSALPTGLAVNTIYYVISAGLTADVFEVSTSRGGSAVNTSGSQSGTHTFLKVSSSPGIPVIHHTYLCRYTALPFLIEKEKPQVSSIAALIQQDEQAIQRYFANRDKDVRKGLRPAVEDCH